MNLPVQLNPLPVNPILQAHVYDPKLLKKSVIKRTKMYKVNLPIVFVHIALLLQLLTNPVAHSFISVNHQYCYQELREGIPEQAIPLPEKPATQVHW
jgi:hypothetical protein